MLRDSEYYWANFALLSSYAISSRTDKHVFVKSLYNNEREIITCYKIRTMEDICAMIRHGEALNLDGCYIKNFSYPTIQQECGRESVLHGFSARGAYFDGNTDFSHTRFADGEKSFHDARFGKGSVRFQNAKFGKGNVDFEYTHFDKGDINFESAAFGTGNISFRSAQFGAGNVDFRFTQFGADDVSFREAQFGEGDISFLGVQFGAGDLYFNNAQFGAGDVVFNGAEFGEGNVSFWEAQFGTGDVSFNNAQFGAGNVYFAHTQFGEGNLSFLCAQFGAGTVLFTRAQFGKGDVDFESSQFSESKVSFLLTEFDEGNINFNSVQFSKTICIFILIDLKDSKLNFSEIVALDSTLHFDRCSFNQHVNLRVCELRTLEFVDCIIEKNLLINSSRGEAVIIHRLNLEDCKNLTSLYIDWEIARRAIYLYGESALQEVRELPKVEYKRALHALYTSQAKQFQLLKENYHNLGEYDHEDAAYVEYMRCICKTLTPIKRLFPWLLDIFGSYGTKPWKLSLWMIFVVVFFSFLYTFALYQGTWFLVNKAGFQNNFTKGCYISIINFLTIGDNDISPLNEIAATLIVLEGFFGFIFMSYFIAMLIRKTLP